MHPVYVTFVAIAFAEAFIFTSANELKRYHYSYPLAKSYENDQYFTQDGYGQYSYGYKAPQSKKQEMRTLDGVTRGSYSYIDGAGIWQTVQYIADSDGFHVTGTNIPQNDAHEMMLDSSMNDSEEVISARALQTSEYVKEKARSLPQPVQDTADVAVAKEKFFKRYAEEQQRHKAIRDGARFILL